MSLFYRSHYSSQHEVEWQKGGRTSFHHWCDGIWMDLWDRTKSRDEADYPLATIYGTYTAAARSYFLKTAVARGGWSAWTKEDERLSSELAGLCAFDSPAGLAAWFRDRDPGGRVIEFEGTFVCEGVDGDGSVAAQFTKLQRHWPTVMEFRKCFGL